MTPAVRSVLLDKPGPILAADFGLGVIPSYMTFARASGATSGTYLDASGSSYTTYATNEPRFLAGGVKVEPARTNHLLNSAVPATQTTASLATGTYCLWVIGSGSATSSAGSATGSGFGAATAGVPNVFTLTVAGTINVTVSGSLDRFQLELSAAPTTFITTSGVVATRAVEQLYCTTALISANSGMLAIDLSLDFVDQTVVPIGLATSSFSDTLYYSPAVGGAVAIIGSSSIGTTGGLSIQASGRNKFALGYRSGQVLSALNGVFSSGVLSSPAPYTPWASRLSLGCSPWGLDNQVTGTVYGFRLYQQAVSAAFLGALTR